MSKIIVFDVDNTLSNANHRQHHVQQKPKRWDLFNAKMHEDPPQNDIIWLAQTLHAAGNTIVICSGRGSENRDVTEKWLIEHDIPFEILYMRKEKDSRRDDIVKVELLEQIRKDFGEPYLWFDDRKQVVDAIRAQGIRVCQVQEGDF